MKRKLKRKSFAINFTTTLRFRLHVDNLIFNRQKIKKIFIYIFFFSFAHRIKKHRRFQRIRKSSIENCKNDKNATTKNQFHFRFRFSHYRTCQHWKRNQSKNKCRHNFRESRNHREFREQQHRDEKKQKCDENEFCEKTINADNSKTNRLRIFFLKWNLTSR